MFFVFVGVGVYGVMSLEEGSGGEVIPVSVEVSTGSAFRGTEFGLLPAWQEAYNGSFTGSITYDFDGDGVNDTEQCGNCHMMEYQGSGGFSMKHEPPLHPLRYKATYGAWNYPTAVDTRYWFHDDDLHRGPNTELAYQEAGIRPQGSRVVQCGDCHTPRSPEYLATSAANTSNDPHSVHRDVLTREGCIRCHTFNNRTFQDSLSVGDISVSTLFVQGNATRSTYGIANPINMTRVWDNRFLSTVEEANYSYDAGSGGLNSSGQGWNVYGSPETSRASQYGCGDCHDQFHAQQGLTGTPVEFSFNDSAGSRKGPYAPVNDSKSYGVNASGYKTCGVCHVTDAHAVHTNGLLNSQAAFSAVNDPTDQSIINSGVLGAELCDECHSQNTGGSAKNPLHPFEPDKLGLGNKSNSDAAGTSHDRLPDLQSLHLGSDLGTDCGFCHI